MQLSSKFWVKISFFLICFYSLLNAQTIQSISSYRKVGLGEFSFNENTATQSMGGLSTVYVSPFGNEINFFNPSANTTLNETVFNLSGSYDYVKYKNSSQNSSYNQFNFDRIALAFPINKKIKTGIGFRQNAVAQYNELQITKTEQKDISGSTISDPITQTISNTYSGGLNNLQSFVSYEVSDKLSFGLKLEYIYGHLIKEDLFENKNVYIDKLIIEDTSIQKITQKIIQYNKQYKKSNEKINQTNFTLGTNYKIPIKKKSAFLIGTTIGMGTAISKKSEITNENNKDFTVIQTTVTNATSTTIEQTKNELLNESDSNYPTSYKDTSSSSYSSSKTTLDPMQNFSFAVGYEQEEKFMIGADFQFNKTGVFGDFINTQLVYNFDQIIDSKVTYQNRYRIALGGWWLPNKNTYKNYFEQVIYRAGLFYEQTPIMVDGKSINDMGASLGFTLPVGKNIKNTLNLGVEYIKRGKTSTGSLVASNYFGIRLGVNFANKWFNQRLIG